MIARAYDRLERRARQELGSGASVKLTRTVDVRYHGQSFEINVPYVRRPAALTRRFEAAHEKRYGHTQPDTPCEVVTLRVRAVVPQSHVKLRRRRRTSVRRGSPRKKAGASRVIQRETLYGSVRGPAVVVEPYATTFVPLSWTARSDEWGNLRLFREGTR